MPDQNELGKTLKLPLKNCNECPLYNQDHYNPNNSTGNVEADILFIGEAPGETEQRTGKCFQGRAGQLLRKLIRNNGLDDERDCFITNVVLCRPDQNKNPEQVEIDCCADNLEHIISIVDPKVIIPLGATAIKRLGVKSKITSARGKVFNSPEYGTVIPCFHPAYILRNASLENTLEQDLAFAIGLSKGAEVERDFDYTMVESLDNFNQVMEKLATARKFSVDIETTGLQYFAEDVPIGIAFSWARKQGVYIPLLVPPTIMAERSYVGDFKTLTLQLATKKKIPKPLELAQYWGEHHTEVIAGISEVLQNEALKTGHNFNFDIKFLESGEFEGVKVNNWVFDSITAHYLLDENQGHGLKAITDLKYTDLRGYSTTLENYLTEAEQEEQSFAKVPLPTLAAYACGDVDATFRLSGDLSKDLAKQPNLEKLMYEFYMPLHKAYKDMEMAGLLVDIEYLELVRTNFEQERDAKAQSIFETAGVDPFNLNSTQQLGAVLYNKMGLPIIEKSPKTGNPSTRAEVLQELAKDHPICRSIISYRFCAKMINTYINGIFDHIDSKNRVHYSYNPRLVTGRLSCKRYAIQTVPRDARVRAMFIASPGHKILGADYSQIELRMLAWYANDKTMMQDFANGIDIHMETAVRMFHKDEKDITPEERKKGKLFSFGGAYGGSNETLVSHVNEKLDENETRVTLEDAMTWRQTFFGRYSRVMPWIQKTIQLAHKHQKVISCFGRIRRLPDIKSMDQMLVHEAERQAVNSLIQGSSSDVLQIANIEIHEYIQDNDLKSKCLFTVHDALYLEVLDDEVEQMEKVVKAIMVKPRPEIKDLPLDIDMNVGNRWKAIPEELHEYLKTNNYTGHLK